MKHKLVIGGTAVWAVLVLTGMALLVAFRLTPGSSEAAPEGWPDESTLQRPAGRPTLVMFARPDCLCTRASIGELAILVSSYEGLVDVSVLVERPPGAAGDLAVTEYWRRASELPGVRVAEDPQGREARRFGARTSGHTVLYDASGRLRFSGGITGGRGHSGDNAGRARVAGVLGGGGASAAGDAPVYGCPIDAAGPEQDLKGDVR